MKKKFKTFDEEWDDYIKDMTKKHNIGKFRRIKMFFLVSDSLKKGTTSYKYDKVLAKMFFELGQFNLLKELN